MGLLMDVFGKRDEVGVENTAPNSGQDVYAKLEELQKAQVEQQANFAQMVAQFTEAITSLKPKPPVEQVPSFEDSLTDEQISAIADDPKKLFAVVKHLAAQEATATLAKQEGRVKALAGEEAQRVYQRDSAQMRFFQEYPELEGYKEYIEFRLKSLNIPPTTTPAERSKFVADVMRRELNLRPAVKPSGKGVRSGAAVLTQNDDFTFDPEDFLGSVETLLERRAQQKG